MVAIPVSPGPRVAPQASPIGVAPINPTAIGNAVSQLGQVGVVAANQQIAVENQRTEALQTAKALEYSTRIKDLDNGFELAAQQTPSTPKAFQGMSERFGKDRQIQIEGLLKDEQDPVVKDLAMRYANSMEVDLKDRLNRYELSKESEYGKHVITEKLDKIGDELLNTSDPKKIGALTSELNATLNSGLKSRYINYDFIEAYQDKVKRISAEREAAAAQSHALNSFLDGTAFADPNNPKDKAIINGAFDRLMKSNDPKDQAKALDLVVKTRIIPVQLVSELSGRIAGGNVDQKVKAAEIISKVSEKNPQMLLQFPQTVQAQALSINRSIEAGILSEQAVLFAEKNIEQNRSFERDRREQTFQMDNAKKLREKNIESLKSELSDLPWSSKSVKVPDALIGQYEYLTKEFYMNTGASYEDAAIHAKKTIKSQWKVTDIGGKPKLQRFAPEAMYPYGSSHEWIKTQLLDTISNQFGNKTADEINSEIDLVVDPDSISTGRPSYLVSRTVDEFGLRDVIRDKNNQPLRFTPDFTKTEEYKKSYLAREALSVSPEVFAEKLYQKAKQREEDKRKLSLDNIRAVSLVGGEAFR